MYRGGGLPYYMHIRSGAYLFQKFQNIPLRSITILQCLPFQRPKYSTCHYPRPPSTAHGRLTQPNSESSVRSPVLSLPSHVSSLRSGAFFNLPRRSGVSSRSECQPDASYSPFRRPTFSRSSSPSSIQSSAFSRSSSPSSLRSTAF